MIQHHKLRRSHLRAVLLLLPLTVLSVSDTAPSIVEIPPPRKLAFPLTVLLFRLNASTGKEKNPAADAVSFAHNLRTAGDG